MACEAPCDFGWVTWALNLLSWFDFVGGMKSLHRLRELRGRTTRRRQCHCRANLFDEMRRMRRAAHSGEHVRLVDLRVGFGCAMDIERLGRFPPLNEQKDLWIGLRVVDLEPQASRFHSRQAALFPQVIADRGNVLLIVDGQENVGVDHARSLCRIDFHPSGYLDTAKNARGEPQAPGAGKPRACRFALMRPARE